MSKVVDKRLFGGYKFRLNEGYQRSHLQFVDIVSNILDSLVGVKFLMKSSKNL